MLSHTKPNLELDLDGYTNYFKNVSILKVKKPYENRLNIEKKLGIDLKNYE